MKKQTILTRAALLVAPFALAATFGTSVVSHADDNSDMDTVTVSGADNSPEAQAAAKKANAMANQGFNKAQSSINNTYKNDDGYVDKTNTATPSKKTSTASNTSKPAAKPATKTTTKKETTSTVAKKAAKKHVAKKVTKKHAKKAAKKATKKVTKKRVAKKHVAKKRAKKHARRLFRIRVKARRIFAYRTLNFRHHHGRRAEKKGTKLYVYKVVRRHHRNYYKVYGGHWITSYHKYVARIHR